MFEGDDWNAVKFNISQLFADYPILMYNYFNVGFKIIYYGSYTEAAYITVSDDI